MPSEIQGLNEKISQINSLVKELEPEFQRAKPRAERDRIRFPWGIIKTANEYRNHSSFIADRTLNSNIAYTLQLTNIFRWLADWFDLKGVAKEMLIKNGNFLINCTLEAMTYDFIKNHVPERVSRKSFRKNLNKLLKHRIVTQDQFETFEECRRMKDDIHLFLSKQPEIEKYKVGDYNFVLKCMNDMRTIFIEYIANSNKV